LRFDRIRERRVDASLIHFHQLALFLKHSIPSLIYLRGVRLLHTLEFTNMWFAHAVFRSGSDIGVGEIEEIAGDFRRLETFGENLVETLLLHHFKVVIIRSGTSRSGDILSRTIHRLIVVRVTVVSSRRGGVPIARERREWFLANTTC